jgi:outer membrane lipoprotein-sorting protein
MKLFQSILLSFGITCSIALTSSQAQAMDAASKKDQVEIVQNVVMRDHVRDGASFISQMIAAAGALNNYSSQYKMTVPSRRVIENGIMYFRKPRLLRVEVKSGPKKGSVAVLCQDGKVRGRMGGALSLFTGSLSANSSMLRAVNGFPMVGTDFLSLAQYLKDKMLDKGDKSLVTVAPKQTVNTSNPAYILDMFRGVPGQERLIKRVYVDPKTTLPVYWEDYEDGKLWSQSSWSDLRVNQDFPNKLFTGA